jgi:glycerophosphoryl diester phosphodiesterase
VVVWTVDDDERLRHWLGAGVDVVTTNRPLAALAIRESMHRESAP